MLSSLFLIFELAIETMLHKLGFNTMDEYRLDLAFTKRFPHEVRGEQIRNNLPGIKTWFNTARPLTQFDKAPERGTTGKYSKRRRASIA